MEQIVDGAGAEETPLYRFLTYRLHRVHAKLNSQATRILEEIAGLSLTQWRIVALVGSMPGATSTDLVRLSGIDKGLFSRKLKTLVAEGLIRSGEGATDSRVHPLSLTRSGQALYDRVLPVMQARQTRLQSVLEGDEYSVLMGALEKLERLADTTDRAAVDP